MTPNNNPIRGVLLDVDGTLVASNDAHAYAWSRAMKECGHAVPFKVVRPLMGMGGDKLIPRVIGVDADSEEGKRIAARRSKILLQDYLPALRPTPGAEELLQALRDRGFRMAVASSSKKDELEPLLKLCNAGDYITNATSSDDAENSKPDPDILHAALQRLGVPASEAVLIGDTPYDVEAARRAGMRVIALSCGGCRAADLRADEVYADPNDLRSKLDQSMLSGRS